jgi:hypothetical protein
MSIPIVDILYFGGTIILVVAVGIFIVRSMRSGSDGTSESSNNE